MIESIFSTIAFALLLIALVIQIIYLIKKGGSLDPITPYIFIIAFALLLTNTVIRSVNMQFVAVTNTFESLIIFSQAIILILFIYRMKSKDEAFPFLLLGGNLVAILLLALASSPIIPKEIEPPVPALQSYWLVLHVIFAFVGEAFFAVGFVSSIYYLVCKDDEKKRKVDRITYTSIIIGYFIYTAGALIFGMIWAHYAWGRYWSWDPKETWALITWLVYTGYLHIRLIKMKDISRKRRTISAIASIIGFLVALFTFFGVNYLLSGLHSYT